MEGNIFYRQKTNSSEKCSIGGKHILDNKDDEMKNSTFAIKTDISCVCKNIRDNICKALAFSHKAKEKVDDLEDLILNFDGFKVQTDQKNKETKI